MAPDRPMGLGDWQVALIHQAQSGFPFTISVFGDTANAGASLNVNPVRANVVQGASPYLPDDERSANRWFNTAAFATPPAFTFGNVGRNTVYGPGLQKTDVALAAQLWPRRPDGARHPAGGLQPVQPHEPWHARALRQHAAVRQRHHGRHTCTADSVCWTFHVLKVLGRPRTRAGLHQVLRRGVAGLD